MQAQALAAVASGADVLYIDRTGGGKSLVFQLPAAALWIRDMKRGVVLPALTLVVVPLIALGEHQEAAMERFLCGLFTAGQLERRARSSCGVSSLDRRKTRPAAVPWRRPAR